MKFTIDYSRSYLDVKRLKNNGAFEKIYNEKNLYDDDHQFSSWYDADNWLTRNSTVEIGGKEVETNPQSVLLGSPTISIEPHRITKPRKVYVTKEELRSLLINGDDSHYNMLVIDFDGIPHLIPRPSFSYAVRLEGFAAGNGYVGEHSKLNHFNDTYMALLEAWLLHLECDESIYQDYSSGKHTVEELIDRIQKRIENFV